ncbi:outer membrane beta-barrel protein [Carboxylicivirga caseinilyticus]|uniref:outer membrane beta-barrel protein n=1 Tax=Carboxylicivirga caseinilyticus TaxID=3417572 RepID=UPI003D34D276|nr:outer membrane beta-barrel protein [Marinilabiliaceae bacterium A049]
MLDLGNKIDETFRNGLGGMEIDPSPNVWSGIESGLNSGGKKKGLFFIWSVVAAASILAAVMTTIFLFQDKNPNDLSSSMAELPNTIIEENNFDNKINPQINNYELGNTNGKSEVKQDDNKLILALKGDPNNKTSNTVFSSSTDVILNREEHFNYLNRKGIEGLDNYSEINSRQLKSDKKNEYFPLYAYNEEVKSKNDYQLLVGGAISSAYNYRQTSGAPVRSYDSYTESGVNSMGGGINVRIETRKRWSIETGVVYAQLGQEINSAVNYQSDFMYSDAMINASMDMPKTYNNSMGKIKFNTNNSSSAPQLNYEVMGSIYDMALLSEGDGIRQTLEYIEIPLMARYKLIEGFSILSIAGGLSSNILVGNTAYLLDGNNRLEVGEMEGIKPVSWSSSVGLGFEVPVTKIVRISIEPRFKYYIESINNNSDYNFQPYAFSVFGGISFLLK